MVRALDRKLFRDLLGMRAQALTIALVVAAGVGSFVAVQSTWASLLRSRDAYYERERFGDVFARLERAPLRVEGEIERIPGVAMVYTRVSRPVLLPVPFLLEPAPGWVVSLPEDGVPPLNGIHLREGRLPSPERDDEALLLEVFATKHGVEPGDVLPVVLDGKLRQIRITGIAMSPEFVFATGGGADMSGELAVLYVTRRMASAAFGLDGAFDDVVLRLAPDASEPAVLAAVDRVLAPYGGRGAVTRALQPSSYVVDGELAQLESMATVVPFIFLGVAAFLVNVVLSRLVQLQRGQIAALKALGYSNLSVGAHYLELVSVIVVLGLLIGVPIGAGLGRAMTALYTDFFRFPLDAYRLDVGVVAVGTLVSLVSALGGAIFTVRGAVRLPPAEAMRPPPPARYSASFLSGTPIARLFETTGRMVLRDLERRPMRTLLSALGIGMAIAILVVGRFSQDAMDFLLEEQFQRAMRDDLTVVFMRPTSGSAIRSLETLPGVTRVEVMRQVPVRFRAGPRYRDGVVLGYDEGMELRSLIDENAQIVPIPEEGVVLTRKLGEILGLAVGDDVELELLEGQRDTRHVRVVALSDEMYGLSGHMRLRALNHLVREDRMISTALLSVDSAHLDDVRRRIAQMPGLAAVYRRESIIERFREQTGRSMGAITMILTFFAGVIAVGVVYNNARVALSQRERDLASLRVIGFTRAEIARVLFGELSFQIILAVPFGLVAGTILAHAVMSTADPERYRLPPIISSETYAFAVLVALIASVVSAFLVRRRLDRLDLIGVLKTRE